VAAIHHFFFLSHQVRAGSKQVPDKSSTLPRKYDSASFTPLL
jgi:hypothetical protein